MEAVDALWSPVGGVTLDLYAAVTVRALRFGFSPSETAGLASAEGIAATDWEAAAEAWRARIGASESVRIAYAAPYARARVS